MKDNVLLLLCVALIALPASLARAHGGVGLEKDPCARRAGQYLIHFAAYQPQFNPSGEYCADLPQAGTTTLAFDLVDPALRSTPLAIRVVEATDATEPRTVLYVPAKTYPNGVVNAEANFDLPGTYTAIVTLEEPQLTISFPIRVGLWSATFAPLVGIVVVGSVLYYFVGRKKDWPLPFRRTNSKPKLRLVKS
jgi:hypothetical protein